MKRIFLLSKLARACLLTTVVIAPVAIALQPATVIPPLAATPLNAESASMQQMQSDWQTELPHPVVKVLTSREGTAYAISYDESADRLWVYAINQDGQIENGSASINLEGNKFFFNSTSAQPVLHTDGNIYLPVQSGCPAVATLYQINPNKGFESRIIFQQGYANSNNNKQWNELSSFQFGNNDVLYIGTREADPLSHGGHTGMIYAIDLKNPDSRAWLWKEKISLPVHKITLNPQGDKVAVRNSEHGNGVWIFNAEGMLLSEKNSDLLPQSPSVAIDSQGAVYGAHLTGPQLMKTSLFESNAQSVWITETTQGEQQSNFGHRWISLGAKNEVYMTFASHVYALNRDNGENLFSLSAPGYTADSAPLTGNRFLNYGPVVTDPVSGWGYLSYVQKTPVPRVGVLGFSPGGEQQQRLFEIEGNFDRPNNSAAAARLVEMTEPVIFQHRIYFAVNKTLYAVPLHHEINDSDVVISELSPVQNLQDDKFKFDFKVTTPEAAIVTTKMHCQGIAAKDCAGPNVIATVLSQEKIPATITMDYRHGLPAKAGKYMLTITTKTRAGEETRRDIIITLK